jgi:hypothetical protein
LEAQDLPLLDGHRQRANASGCLFGQLQSTTSLFVRTHRCRL